jgi:membrane glycosyltransferase
MATDEPDPRAQVPPFFPVRRARRRRLAFMAVCVLANLGAVLWLADYFWRTGFHRAHLLLLAVFVVLNGLLVLGSFHAFAGVFDFLVHRRRLGRITSLAEGCTGPLRHRHAVVMPVYNEDSARFCARIEAIYRSIEAAGHLESFDFYILSDTRDHDLWVLEEVAWTNMCRRLGAFGRIYYRRRKFNTNRKAGNIGDFVRVWGGHYEGMLVLDADSLMAGADIMTLARVMEVYPRVGILQTAPRLIRGSSLFARLQHFAMRLYGPLFTRGLNFWQLGCGSYWGHNAMIRVRPFAEFCELPALPGREPFGGRILSHDFVEAGLMVAAGWEVWLAWDIEGTYEESPPTLVDHLKRDRRWCQGNLQHLWLVFSRKLPVPVRVHLLMGIMAYLGSPLWFLFLALGTWVAWDRSASNLSVLPFDGFVGRWLHIGSTVQGLGLGAVVLGLIFMPKVLAALGAIAHPGRRRAFGGIVRMTAGFLLENLFSILLAPCFMAAHTFMVAGIIAGRSVSWGSQNRDAEGTSWADAVNAHGSTTVLGVVWTLVAILVGPTFAAWMSPILLGMLVSVPLSVFTSRSGPGRVLAGRGVLVTPEDRDPPPVIRLADAANAAADPVLDASHPARRGVIAAVVDPYVNGVHVSLLDPGPLSPALERIAERALHIGVEALNPEEREELVGSGPGMLHLHRTVWLSAADTIHPCWRRALDSYRHRGEVLPGGDEN